MKRMPKSVTMFRTDGLVSVAGYAWKYVCTTCGLRASETLFFRRGESAISQDDRQLLACNFVRVGDAVPLEKYGHPRLRHIPYREWFAHGAVCFVGLVEGKVVSYCWVHRESYCLGKIGRFVLQDGEVWIGPVFVDKRFRRRGINTGQIKHSIHELGKGRCRVFFTAANSQNYASIRSFVKCGFTVVGISRIRTFGGQIVSNIMCELDNERRLRESLI